MFVGFLGLALLYAALFLHETEEGQTQNRLEKFLVDIDDLSKTALSKQTAFLQRVSAMANSALNKLFGVRLFSTGAVAASLCFSVGSSLLVELTFGVVKDAPNLELALMVVGIVSFLVGLLPIPFRYFGFPWIFGIVFLGLHNAWKGQRQEGWAVYNKFLSADLCCARLWLPV